MQKNPFSPYIGSVKLVSLLLLLVLLGTSCKTASPIPAPATVAPTLIPTPTIQPEKKLTVCLAQEPESLFLYANATESAWSILEALYDGPIDMVNFIPSPVILDKLPSLKDGNVIVQPVAVTEGDPVVDASGSLAALKPGLLVRPSGCNSTQCAAAWDGNTELKMDQVSVRFKLKDGLLWSDGSPLTADDSVFSFTVASDPAIPVSKYLVDRTISYATIDPLTVEWKGLPGYIESSYTQNYFSPLPKHLLGSIKPADLLTAPEAVENPVGWGPFVLKEWVKGDHITFTKNANYFRAAEGLPKIDTLIYKFLGTQADNNLAALQQGDCDLVDSTAGLETMLEQVLDSQKAGTIKAFVGQGPEWEEILFNIVPASYADGNSPLTGDRADFFGDARTRRALAMCMDRDHAVNKQLLNQSIIPDGFLPPTHPLAAADLQKYPYSVEAGAQLLDEVGWKDTDGNPATPRVAYAVPGVQDGTEFRVSYLVTNAYLRQEIVKVLAQSASACGVEIVVKTTAPEEMYAAAPEGELFGRKFDMAQIAWQAGPVIPCGMFTSSQIPNPQNQWMGINLGGYANPEFDAACSAALAANPNAPDFANLNAAVQKIFASDLPAIPLYFHLKIAAARPDFCGLEMDVSSRSVFRALESFEIGSECPQ